MDLHALRKEYETSGLRAEDLPADPVEGVKQWVQLALERCPADWFEVNTFSLATSSLNGQVTCRILLLKKVLPEGIVFFSNYESSKGQQLLENPHASACFHWPYLSRQVRLTGEVIKTSRELSEEYFHSRPRGSQIGAVVSAQSTELAEERDLQAEAEQLDQQYAEQTIPLPDNWGGYLLQPLEVEFWQGRTSRLHDRIVYRRDQVGGGQWERSRLAP